MNLRGVILLTFLVTLLQGCFQPANRATVVADVPTGYGTSAIWHPRLGQLCWVDVNGKTLNLYNPVLTMHRELYLGQRVFAVAPIDNGEVLILLENGFYTLNPATGTKQFLLEMTEGYSNIHEATGAIDPNGNYWISVTALNESTTTALFRIENNQSIELIADGMGISGGMGWSIDQPVLYYLDSDKGRLLAFTVDLLTGKIIARTDIFEFSLNEATPKGMTPDSNGNLWIGYWDYPEISCINPASGDLLLTIDIPARFLTSITYGDADSGTLYFTTARNSLDGSNLSDNPKEGFVYRFPATVAGTDVPVITNL